MPATVEQEKKNFSKPDDKRSFHNGTIEVINVSDMTIGRSTLQPGWKWSSCVKPIANTEWCEASHLICQISGRMHVKMRDGAEFDLGPGDVATIPPGHDAWVVGNEPAIALDITGAENYAKHE